MAGTNTGYCGDCSPVLGYYLDAEVIKIIGMILVGIVLVLLC